VPGYRERGEEARRKCALRGELKVVGWGFGCGGGRGRGMYSIQYYRSTSRGLQRNKRRRDKANAQRRVEAAVGVGFFHCSSSTDEVIVPCTVQQSDNTIHPHHNAMFSLCTVLYNISTLKITIAQFIYTSISVNSPARPEQISNLRSTTSFPILHPPKMQATSIAR
jgi:hypothetical protein